VFAVIGLGALLFNAPQGSYAAANLLDNGYFDSGVGNWSALVGATVTHQADLDYYDDTASGSAYVARSGAGPADAIVMSDCIDLTSTGAGTYEITAQAQRDPANWSGQGTPATSDDPTVEVIVTKYDDNTCSTNPVTSLSGSVLLSNDNWFPIPSSGPGDVIVTTELGVTVSLVIHAQNADDAAWFDIVGFSLGALDTPTPTNTPTATNTVPATNTPTSTNTPEPTATEVPTNTPTATFTSTPIPPTATNTPVPVVDDSGAPPEAEVEVTSGEQPEDGVGAGGEEPEGSEFPESGYGPGSYQQGRSHAADVIATAAFALAIVMLGTGFALRRKYEEQEF
jgi:hypothetical protein